MLDICILGTGYVGLVTGTCLAEIGHRVTCVDNDAAKVERLRAGGLPIYEPGLGHLVRSNVSAGRLSFTGDLHDVMGRPALVLFVAIGTPPAVDGSAELHALLSAVDDAARVRAACQPLGHLTIVIKSTVPVGTCRSLQAMVARRLGRAHFAIVSNPEFLREGSAVSDFMEPDRIVVGSDDHGALAVMRKVYEPLTAKGRRLIEIETLETSEMIKYAANAFLATRVGLLNEFALLCEKVNGDIKALADAVGADRRIGHAFLEAGPGFGGSCFPKDLRALTNFAAGHGCGSEIAAAVIGANERQKQAMVAKVSDLLGGMLKGRRIAVLGLAFKAGTDDVREAPALILLEALAAGGAETIAYDPVAGEQALRQCPTLHLADTIPEALADADVAVIATEWKEFLHIDWEEARLSMRQPNVVDFRNMLDARSLTALGFTYRGIGRLAGGEVPRVQMPSLPASVGAALPMAPPVPVPALLIARSRGIFEPGAGLAPARKAD